MKKLLAMLLVMGMLASWLTACGDFTIQVKKDEETRETETSVPETSEPEESLDAQGGDREEEAGQEETDREEEQATTAAAEEETTEEPTEATEPATDPVDTAPDIGFNAKYTENGVPDVTLRYIGETWACYKGSVPLEEITWKSDNEAVATVENGVVTVTGSGYTTIHAIWGEYDVVCVVRCIGGSAEEGLGGSGGNIGEG